MRILPNHDTSVPSLLGTLVDTLRQSLGVEETGAGVAGLSRFAQDDLVKINTGFGHLENRRSGELGSAVQ